MFSGSRLPNYKTNSLTLSSVWIWLNLYHHSLQGHLMESWATTTISCRGGSRGTSSRTGTGSTGGTSAASAAWTSSASRRPSSSRCSRKSCSRVSEYAARVSKLRCTRGYSVEERPRLGCVSSPERAGANSRTSVADYPRDRGRQCYLQVTARSRRHRLSFRGTTPHYNRNWRREQSRVRVIIRTIIVARLEVGSCNSVGRNRKCG